MPATRRILTRGARPWRRSLAGDRARFDAGGARQQRLPLEAGFGGEVDPPLRGVLGARLEHRLEAERGHLVRTISEGAGPLHCVVNNASLFEPDHGLDFDPALARSQLEVNLIAPLTLARDLARHFGTLDRIMDAMPEQLLQVADVGPIVAAAIRCSPRRSDTSCLSALSSSIIALWPSLAGMLGVPI